MMAKSADVQALIILLTNRWQLFQQGNLA